MREFVKVLPLGLLLPLVIGAASVKPDDAISNISDWAHRFGFEGAAKWLANPAADNRVILGSLGIAAFYAFLVWTVPAIKERRTNPESPKLKTHLLTMAFYFACAVIVVVVWRFVPAPTPPAKPAPPVVPAAPPSPKPTPTPTPPPWVSNDEIEKQRKLDRKLLIYSPQELFAMYVGGQNLNALLGNWVQVDGATSSLPISEKIQNKEFYRVEFKLQNVSYSTGKVAAYFDPKKYGAILLSTRPGDNLRAICQWVDIDLKQPNPSYSIYFITWIFHNCELP